MLHDLPLEPLQGPIPAPPVGLRPAERQGILLLLPAAIAAAAFSLPAPPPPRQEPLERLALPDVPALVLEDPAVQLLRHGSSPAAAAAAAAPPGRSPSRHQRAQEGLLVLAPASFPPSSS